MSLVTDVQAILEADTTLAALLTGGVQTGLEITRQLTPEAFDANSELQPCALVKATSENKAGPHSSSVQTTLSIFFYELDGADVIEDACERVFILLNERHLSGIWQILFGSETPYDRDDALNCALKTQRYYAYRSKV